MNFFGIAVFALLTTSLLAGENWPGFRGYGTSSSKATGLPTLWSEDKVAWHVDLAGYGQSSPVIWDETVFVTSASGDQKQTLTVQAFNLKDGIVRWKSEVLATQRPEKVSDMISRSAPTPVVDEANVYAFYESGDLLCIDHAGAIQWQRQLTKEYGDFKGAHGVGSSLVRTPDHLVLLIDHSGPSYLLCLDKKTGDNVWKVEREERVSWTTPLYHDHGGIKQVIISSNGVAESYALADGQQLWKFTGIEKNTVASPSVSDDLVIVGSSSPRHSLAIKLGGKGDVTETHLKWRAESATSSFGSPLIHGDVVYFVNRAGVLHANRLSDGTSLWKYRLPASTWASPLSTPEHLYFFCKDGQTVVIKPREDGPEIIATNVLKVEEKDRHYGYAISKDAIIMRTEKSLVCLR